MWPYRQNNESRFASWSLGSPGVSEARKAGLWILGTVAFVSLILAACLPASAKPLASGGQAPAPDLARVESQGEPGPCDTSRARVSLSGWRTDFSRCLVPFSEFRGGGPGRDGIPPIDAPRFVSPTEASAWLQPREPVISLAIAGEARAYPIQILIWHEIVNDTLGGLPVAVTFCPLCNAAIVFDRQLDGRLLDFGTTGNLRYSDLVMWDRQTESWWQQATGEAVVGELAGARLRMVPAQMISFEQFRQRHPTGAVLSRETGFRRDYGRNPYPGYDDISQSPFLFDGPRDGRLRAMERVVTVNLGGESVAYPFSRLAERGVVNDVVGGQPIVIFYQPGTASPLDSSVIATARDVGSVAVFLATHQGTTLTFGVRDGQFLDQENGSRWNLLGVAESGPLAGALLEAVVYHEPFWFAAAAFDPNIRIWSP